MTRIAIFTDVHHNDSNVAQRHCTSAIPSLRSIFNHFANPDMRPDAVVTLGDNILARRGGALQDCIHDDAERLDEVLGCFAESGISKTFHLHGNHEDKNMPRFVVDRIAARHNTAFGSRVIELEDVSLVLWSPDVRILRDNAGALPFSDSELEWLSSTLDNVRHPAIVMTHLPLDGDVTNFLRSTIDGRPNPVFGKKVGTDAMLPYGTHHPNVMAARRIIEKSEKVVACLAGHTHWNEMHFMGGVAYITLPSLVENANGKPHGGWAMIDVSAEGPAVRINVHGATPCTHMLGPAAMGPAWREFRL
jgi:Icc protein